MKSGRRTLHWDTPEPQHVRRRHEDPDRGDNFGQLHRAAREAIGRDDIIACDCNFQAVWSKKLRRWVKVCMHWRDPGRNGYTQIRRRLLPGTRRMTQRELRRTNWTWEQVRRWRRPNGERPRTYEEMITEGFRVGVVVIAELKHPWFGHADLLRDLVSEAKRHDHPAWTMVLITMDPRAKVAAARQAGAQIAIIFGNFQDHPKPASWDDWSFYPNRMWGPASAQRWLPA